MSYLAIARKYRPSTFEQMVGQNHVTRTLANAIRSGRIHHAYLFCGARGVGKTTAARALARSLNCARGPTPEPCGECPSCRDVLAGSSPDLMEIDGASNNSVDDIRALRDTVGYAPTSGKYRIYLIDEVHMLSKPAFNALLKTLEEPPAHVVFIFATTEAAKIPDTILSRVQRFDFKRIAETGVVERLAEIAVRENVRIQESGLRMIARAGEGSMRDAQSLLDKVIAFSPVGVAIDDRTIAETLGLVDRALLHRLFEALVAGDAAAALDSVASAYHWGHELTQLTEELLEIVRHATFVRMGAALETHVDLAAEEVQRLRDAVAGTDAEALGRLFAALVDLHDQVARAPRPRAVLEMGIARLVDHKPTTQLSGFVGRLESLERRLRQANPAPARAPSHQAPRPPTAREPASPRRASKVEDPPPDEHPRPPVAPAPEPLPAVPAETPIAGWAVFSAAIAKIGGLATALLQGEPRRTDTGVAVDLPAGRSLAEARRALRSPEVEAAVTAHLPPGTTLSALPRTGTGTSADEDTALEREILDDPTIVRMMAALGAELDGFRRDGPPRGET